MKPTYLCVLAFIAVLLASSCIDMTADGEGTPEVKIPVVVEIAPEEAAGFSEVEYLTESSMTKTS